MPSSQAPGAVIRTLVYRWGRMVSRRNTPADLLETSALAPLAPPPALPTTAVPSSSALPAQLHFLHY